MILVTGATGLVGSHLLAKLTAKKHKIKALKRNSSDILRIKNVFSYYYPNYEDYFQKVEWVEADITDYYSVYESCKGIEKIYHCAGIVSYLKKNKKQVFSVNIDGTKNVVNASLENNISKLLYVSSIASLGNSENGELITENTPWQSDGKNSFYSISKFRAENEVWRGIAEGLDAVIVNPSVVLGHGFWEDGIGAIMKMISKGFKYYTLGGAGIVDVRDLATIMIQLMDSNIKNEKFIVSAENKKCKDFVTLISKEFGFGPPTTIASAKRLNIAHWAQWIGSLFTGKEPVMTKDFVRIIQSPLKYSNKKLVEQLNTQFTPLKDTIHYVVEKYKEDMNH